MQYANLNFTKNEIKLCHIKNYQVFLSDWYGILDDKFIESIEMVRPTDLLNGYFWYIFKND